MADNGARAPEPQRYSREAARPRKHMGTASSDSEYLPLTRRTEEGLASLEGSNAQSSVRIAKPKLKSSVTQYDRYLQVPKRSKKIFVHNARARRRRGIATIAIAVLALVLLAVVWFFILR